MKAIINLLKIENKYKCYNKLYIKYNYMHDIFTIKELLEHILSFIPRKIIISSVLTCKRFYNAIKIDYDQENVAKNSDMFSLTKIPYSLMVVANISVRNNNIKMFEYLLEKHKFNVPSVEGLCKSIGYSGNVNLLNKYLVYNQLRFEILLGICEGSHVDLFDKYDVYCDYECMVEIYKTNIDKTKIDKILLERHEEEADEIVFEGYCIRETSQNVKKVIQKLIDNMSIEPIIDNIYMGLVGGNHYDLITWLDKIHKFPFNDTHILANLIIKNNFKMFAYLISLLNNNFCNGRIKMIVIHWYCEGNINYVKLFNYCIDYRRLDMLEFLIKNIIFNNDRYKEFMEKAESLLFDDVKNLLITNSSLFETFDEIGF